MFDFCIGWTLTNNFVVQHPGGAVFGVVVKQPNTPQSLPSDGPQAVDNNMRSPVGLPPAPNQNYNRNQDDYNNSRNYVDQNQRSNQVK